MNPIIIETLGETVKTPCVILQTEHKMIDGVEYAIFDFGGGVIICLPRDASATAVVEEMLQAL